MLGVTQDTERCKESTKALTAAWRVLTPKRQQECDPQDVVVVGV
jgi:hypothetical protein